MKEAIEFIEAPTPIRVYESGVTDGYTNQGDGKFFSTRQEASDYATLRNKGYGRVSERWALRYSSGIYLLASPQLFTLSEITKEELKRTALAKLSAIEKEVLGL